MSRDKSCRRLGADTFLSRHSAQSFEHGEVEQLATCIETLLKDPGLAREMGKRGLERTNREFKFNVFAKAFRKILRELCES